MTDAPQNSVDDGRTAEFKITAMTLNTLQSITTHMVSKTFYVGAFIVEIQEALHIEAGFAGYGSRKYVAKMISTRPEALSTVVMSPGVTLKVSPSLWQSIPSLYPPFLEVACTRVRGSGDKFGLRKVLESTTSPPIRKEETKTILSSLHILLGTCALPYHALISLPSFSFPSPRLLALLSERHTNPHCP